MAQASVALKSAKVYLGDINGITWSDSILMPILQEAHGELVQELERYSLSVILNQTTILYVTAGSTSLGNNQPPTLVEPVSIYERTPGTDMENFEPMIRLTFIPLEDQTEELTYWAWLGQVITFLGATQDREILLRYKGSITTPVLVTDSLGFIFAERFIGPRIASIAYDSIGKDGSKFQQLAENNLYKIVQSNVTNDQRPVRRKAYRSPKNLYGPEGYSVVQGSSSSGGSALTWVPTFTPPDGIRTSFSFGTMPKFVSLNGLNQFLNSGYTLAVSGGAYQVTFIDELGNVITPDSTADIREAF